MRPFEAGWNWCRRNDDNDVEIRCFAYLDGAVVSNGVSLEQPESVMSSVAGRATSIVDDGGQRPRYTMRTL
jgi:hypothetical protein